MAGAAPANVYASARRGSPHSYRIPHLDAGFYYTVRMHFADANDTARLMSYSILGTNVLRDFSISSLVGGAIKALVLDFPAQVQDTNGLSISCSGANGSDIFESGFEIMQNLLIVLSDSAFTIQPRTSAQQQITGKSVKLLRCTIDSRT